MDNKKRVERRKFSRIKWIFPVEFRMINSSGEALSDFYQGFTADVSRGGVLMRVNSAKHELIEQITAPNPKLDLTIDIHFGYKPVRATANAVWTMMVKEHDRDKCLIGLEFDNISDQDRKRFMRYVKGVIWGPRIAIVVLSLLLMGFVVEKVAEVTLKRENTRLVKRLSRVLEEKSGIEEVLSEADTEKTGLMGRLDKQAERIKKIEEERDKLIEREMVLEARGTDVGLYVEELAKTKTIKNSLESQMQALTEDRNKLQKELALINQRAELRLRELRGLESKRLKLEKKTVDKMYHWLKRRQSRDTGLMQSYEGDEYLRDTAFTYDQALVAQAFMLFGDIERAQAVLDFFKYKARKDEGAYANSYNVNTGGIIEPKINSGPNIWVGIAMAQYTDMTGKIEYLYTAEEIARWTIGIQREDPGGGIRGGPKAQWFSTEHNLDAYAFFKMLEEITGKARYKEAKEKTLKWIEDNAFNGSGRIKRGRGDATIATDTFSWAVAALGPETLMDASMDPEAIMDFAEEHCKVTVDYKRPDGHTTEVTGFDFAGNKNLPRGGVVSTEWTAQMIVSFKIIRDFFNKTGEYKKARIYSKKYDFYLNQLEKLIISSPSPIGQGAGCLPYATQGNVDTGHGWRTPEGSDTGSVSGTAYGIFAIKGYNPLKLSSKQ
jgi:hypothetical protein